MNQSRDKESLAYELDQAKNKILSLESDLKKANVAICRESKKVTAGESVKPWSKSFTVKISPARQESDSRIAELQKEIKTLKNSLRFTKMVELENEVSVYYKEYSNLKESFKEAYALEPIIKSLTDYKNALDSLTVRSKELLAKNKDLNNLVKSVKEENSQLKKINSQIKKDSKEIHQKSNLVSTQNAQIKKLEKNIKDFELDKTRMAAEFAKSIKELNDTINTLKEENSILNARISQHLIGRKKSKE